MPTHNSRPAREVRSLPDATGGGTRAGRAVSALGAATLWALAPFALAGLQRTFRTSAPPPVVDPGIVAASDPDFPDYVERLTGAAFRCGNEIEILRNGHHTFPRLWADLESAGRSIDVQIYYAQSGAVADRTFAILARRAREGVRVRFLYDPVGCRGLDASYTEALRHAGGRVHALRPLRPGGTDRINHRVHSRIVVVDGEIGYTGDFGFSDRWLGDARRPESWRSTNTRSRGPAVGDHAAAFATLWSEATGELIAGRELLPAQEDGPGVRAALLHTSPSVGSTAAERLWALTLAAAQRTCYIWSGYFAPSPAQAQLLVSAADRGVDVRVLTAAVRHTDIPPVYWAGRSHYPDLLRAGVGVYEYDPSMMHAKGWVVDGTWCGVGALNLDNRSVVLNDDIALLVHDRAVGATLNGAFFDDLTRARRVTREQLEQSGWLDRAKIRGARLIAPLL